MRVYVINYGLIFCKKIAAQDNVVGRRFQYVKLKGITYAIDEKTSSGRSDRGTSCVKSRLENRPLGRKEYLT